MNATNPLAVVTGASSGIGLALARQFARNGYDLVLAAEDAAPASAAELGGHGTEVAAVRTDLATADGVATLHRRVVETRRPVAALALNAGVGRGGAFLETDLADQQRVIDLNISSTVRLARLLVPSMVADGQGRVLVTSSVAATTPGPYQAVYNASKAFLLSFAQALAHEVRDTGVTVTTLLPGPTDTGFFARADMLDTAIGTGPKDDPDQVAAQAFEALMAGRDKVVAGSVRSRLQGLAGRVLPDGFTAEAHRRVAEPGSGDQGS
ncbi:SDR family NAD(P)-dependent oxidoreductase [Streptomyces sp. NPDC058855]|uniref:SDR family NAD(P)-dependent oxidoreductase n=1 Tax=Streptomyces sp. NPDC058855 TaxID=3346651 RepID=UPI0036C3EB6F